MGIGLQDCLTPREARELIDHIRVNGSISYKTHCLERMEERRVDAQDVINVLRGGTVDPAESEYGWWRYRVHTPKIVVVIEFLSRGRLRVVTVMRTGG
jgi:hypothetical protein